MPRRHRNPRRKLNLLLLDLKLPHRISISFPIPIPTFLLPKPLSRPGHDHFLDARFAGAPFTAWERDHDALDVAAATFPGGFL